MGAESSLIREPSTVINMAFRQDDTEDTMDGFNSVSSPGQSSRAVPNLTTSKSEVSPWKPDFLKLRLPHLRVGGQPDVFILRSRINDIHQPLTVIDTISDGETYLDMTRGQWDMAIKKARAKDNVLEKLKDGNSPAGQENIRYPQHSLTSGLENSQVRSVPKKVVNHNFPQHIVGIPNQEYWGSATRLVPAHNNPPGRAPLYSNPAWMGDLCEESYNDSELVKGVGRVIINRKILALVPFIDKPYELLPPSFALRDDLYPLEHMLSSDLKVLNHKIFPAAQVPYDLSLPQALILQWNGKTNQQITVFKVNEIKSINFKDIIKINYNLELWSILIQFSSDQTDKAEELLLAIRPNLLSTWMILQTCCYSITKGKVNGPKCGGASKEFFDDKTKELQKLRIKRAPVSSIPQIIDRGKSRTRTPRSLLSILRSQIRQTARRNMLPFRSSSAQLPIRSVSRLSKLPTSHMSAPPVVHGEAGDIDKSLEDLFREKSSLDSALKSAGDHSHSQASDTDDSLEDLFREKISPDSALNSAGDRSHSQEQDIIPSQCFSNTGAVYMEAADMEINVEQSGLQDEAEAEHDPPHSSKQNSPNIEKDMVLGDSVTTPAAGNAPQRAPSVYYKQSLKYGSLVPVEVNDLVVRLRKERYKEIGGKRDKTDIFDGPWRVTEFGTPDKIYGMSHDGTGPGQYSDVEFKRMLTTRVRLDFPKASVAPRWVQIAQLLPVYEPEIAYDGELYASSWAVSKLRAFKEIQKIIQERKGDTEAPATDEEALPTDVCEDADDEIFHDGQVTIFVAKIKRGVFVAVTQCDPQGPMEGVYEVEKLRRKRLRLYPANSPMVKKQKLKTDKNDPWVQRLRKQLPRLTNKRVIVAEYNVHWTAWPDEDDEWTTGAGNIPQVFIDEYHSLTDPFRDIPMDIDLANPLEMIFGDDLQTERKARKGKARKSTGGGGRQSGLLGNNMEGLEQIHEPQNDYGETLGDEKITARSEAAQAFSEPGEGQKAVDDLDSFHRDIGVEAEDPAGLIDHENEDGEDDENVVMADNEFEDGNEDEDEI